MRAAVRALKPKPSQKRPKFVAWRLRLKKGVSRASEGDLDHAVSWLEGSEIVFGGVVVFGVVLEVIIAALHPSYDSKLGIWGSVVSDAFVLLGVLGEVVASARVTVCQGELTRRSNARLQKAEEDTAKLLEQLRPRWPSDEQLEDIDKAVRPFAGVECAIGANPALAEPEMFVRRLAVALSVAGLKLDFVHPAWRVWSPGGILIFVSAGSTKGAALANALSAALKASHLWASVAAEEHAVGDPDGIMVVVGEKEDPNVWTGELVSGFAERSRGPPTATLASR